MRHSKPKTNGIKGKAKLNREFIKKIEIGTK